MAKTLSWGYTDTPVSGVNSLTFPRAILNFSADFAQKENTSKSSSSELILTNITSPLDRAENIRYAYSTVNNVYSNTSIDAKVQSPNRKGVQLLAQVTDVATVTDSDDASYRVDLPISTHIVIKVPADALITGDIVQAHLGRVVSALFETGSTATTRIQKLLRGALEPADLG